MKNLSSIEKQLALYHDIQEARWKVLSERLDQAPVRRATTKRKTATESAKSNETVTEEDDEAAAADADVVVSTPKTKSAAKGPKANSDPNFEKRSKTINAINTMATHFTNGGHYELVVKIARRRPDEDGEKSVLKRINLSDPAVLNCLNFCAYGLAIPCKQLVERANGTTAYNMQEGERLGGESCSTDVCAICKFLNEGLKSNLRPEVYEAITALWAINGDLAPTSCNDFTKQETPSRVRKYSADDDEECNSSLPVHLSELVINLASAAAASDIVVPVPNAFMNKNGEVDCHEPKSFYAGYMMTCAVSQWKLLCIAFDVIAFAGSFKGDLAEGLSDYVAKYEPSSSIASYSNSFDPFDKRSLPKNVRTVKVTSSPVEVVVTPLVVKSPTFGGAAAATPGSAKRPQVIEDDSVLNSPKRQRQVADDEDDNGSETGDDAAVSEVSDVEEQ